MTDRPEQRPEGELIARALKRIPRLSQRQAAEKAGMSEGNWRAIVSGSRSVGKDTWIPVRGPAETVARMARVVGLTHEAFEGIRDDVMEVMLDQEVAAAEELDRTVVADANEAYARLRDRLGLLSPRQIALLEAVAAEFSPEGDISLNPPEEGGSPGETATG